MNAKAAGFLAANLLAAGAGSAQEDYRFRLDGKPFQPEILHVMGAERKPAPGDLVLVSGFRSTLGPERECAYREEGSRLFLEDGLPGQAGPPDDFAPLLEGVARVGAPGSPGLVSVFGPEAFAVVAGSGGKGEQAAVIAAARHGKGRLVAFGHTGYFGAEALGSLDTGRLMEACVRWAAGGRQRPRVATWRQEEVGAWLQARGHSVKALSRPEAAKAEADVVLLRMDGLEPGQERALAAFVKGGGGVLTAETPWGWLQVNPGKSLREDMAANRLLRPAGLAFVDGIAAQTREGGYAAAAPPGPLLNASKALDLLEAGRERPTRPELRQAAASLVSAIRALPATDGLLLPRLRKLCAAGRPVPSPSRPLGPEDTLGKVLLALELEQLRTLPPERIAAHPAAAHFPGSVPAGAPRVRRTQSLDTGIPGWQSTGLYAPPGAVVEIAATGGAEGLAVRIGAHQDSLWHHEKWSRAPEVAGEWALEGERTRVASPFGGLVYIVVRPGRAGRAVELCLSGAVEAPLFVLGRTSREEWLKRIRALPGPWAELASSKVVLTVPSTHVRELEDPGALMELWDRVLDACAELAGRPRERERPERIVSDVQIGAGYMHAGYPIMTHLDAAARMVDRAEILKGEWGLFHELGHNHQSSDWTFEGAGEVTVNLFTLYVFEKVCGKKPAEARDLLAPAPRARTLGAYLAAPDFEAWKRDPFLALILYVQLQEAFGWEAYRRLFAEYRALPRAERPVGDAAKRDQWLVRFSRAVGRNLGPFFQAWGVPTSAKARREVEALSAWMPVDWPK